MQTVKRSALWSVQVVLCFGHESGLLAYFIRGVHERRTKGSGLMLQSHAWCLITGEDKKRGKVAQAGKVQYSAGQFNRNHLGCVIRAQRESINSEKKTNGTHFRGAFDPFQ